VAALNLGMTHFKCGPFRFHYDALKLVCLFVDLVQITKILAPVNLSQGTHREDPSEQVTVQGISPIDDLKLCV
jgi:hypothetical protein